MRASGASCTFVHTDVRDAAALEGLVAAAASEGAGRLDALVNNAGIEKYAEPSQFTPEDWDSILGTNLRSAFLCSRLAEPHLARTGGSIVNVSSVHAFANERGAAIYAASKTGLLGLTRTLALDFAPRVRVNAVCPGAIQTGLMEKYLASQEDPAAVAEEMGARIPLARVGAPEDVAGVIWFLASPEAAYMTGSTIVVDGGLLARLAI
jgi:NAD(P)-dependent dehydrogenase (short-subunit alcohol dehydrogenase family)